MVCGISKSASECFSKLEALFRKESFTTSAVILSDRSAAEEVESLP
jgi:hypothetical protein